MKIPLDDWLIKEKIREEEKQDGIGSREQGETKIKRLFFCFF